MTGILSFIGSKITYTGSNGIQERLSLIVIHEIQLLPTQSYVPAFIVLFQVLNH